MGLLGRLSFLCRVAWHSVLLALHAARCQLAPGSSGGAGPREPLLVLYSQVPWWGVWQRPQELARGLARGRRVLFFSPIQVHERLGRYTHAQRELREPEGKGLTVLTPAIFSGEYRWHWVFRLNRWLVAQELRQALQGEDNVTLLANTPLVEPLLDRIDFSRVVYDVMDDFAAFDWAPAGANAMHTRLLDRADAVSTGTYTLLNQVLPTNRDATFIPCGVDFDAFHTPDGVHVDEPDDLRGLSRPLIGYVGTLSERIDTDLIADIAARFPEATLVLVGPVYRTLGAPPEAPNIRYLGLKPHKTLPAYLRHFDVALLPFRLNDASLAVNPVKTLEYLAAGCVVVSTAIPDVERFYSDVVLIAQSREHFLEHVATTLGEDCADRVAEGIDTARGATWNGMVERFEALLDGTKPCE